MKKLLGLAAGVALALACVATPIQAAAGGAINPDEQRLLDYVKTGVTIDGETLAYPVGSEEYEMLYDILSANGVELTATDVNTVRDSAKATVTYLSGIDGIPTVDQLMELIDLANPGLDVLGIKATYDATDDILYILTADGDYISSVGDVLGSGIEGIAPGPGGDKKLENTGENFTSTYALIGGLAVVLAGAGIYTFRKKESLN
ncbi:LPXTG cell wall anchor domain-containing protein [Amedibacillus sp. YH-ame10]